MRWFPFSSFLMLFVCVFGSDVSAQKWQKIIDNNQPGYSETGNAWATWNVGGYNNNYRYLSHQGKGLKRVGTATWQVAAPYDGQYDVSVHFRQTVNRTTDADYNVYDGNGKRHHFSLNQQKLASGWHRLGTFYYKKGQTMKVVLDGTDDTQSDEADAVQWVFSSTNPPPPPQKCTQQSPGTYTLTRHAGAVSASGDWASSGNGKGSADGQLISSPNVDSGEVVTASDFNFCTPPGSFQITKVRIGVMAKMQYDSGPYKLILYLEGGGKRFTFSQTSLQWVYGDITSTKASWTINDLNALELKVGLNSHPGGKRDSDAWIDAFEIQITYKISGQTCPSGQQLCAGACVDLSTNALHCGGCGKACVAGQSCVSGVCVVTCPSGETLCGGQCVNTQDTLQHCGACGKACSSGQFCLKGVCQETCQSPRKTCGGQCVDVQTNASHCGACNTGCGEGEACVDGKCLKQCNPNEIKCNGNCFDPYTDPNHCGGCFKLCQPGETCVASICKVTSGCTAEQLQCGGQCVDVRSHPAHCGACGNACSAGERCEEGQCKAREGERPLYVESYQDAGGSDGTTAKETSYTPRGQGCVCVATGHSDVDVCLVLLWLFVCVVLYERLRGTRLS